MTPTEIKEKFLRGGKLAIERLLEKKRKENGYVVVSENGMVVQIDANDIPKKDVSSLK